MQWKIGTAGASVAVDEQHESLNDKLNEMGDFSFLDDLQDDKRDGAEMPFPYGSPSARPYGWFSM